MHPFLRTALRAASAAANVHRRHGGGRVDVDGAVEKGYSDFVTRVDLEAQAEALEVLRRRHPDHRILAEEEDETADEALVPLSEVAAGGTPLQGPLWIVDPLDGTTNFLHGHPMYSASVGLFIDGRPVAGAVECAATGERWWAARGRGAYKDGRRIRVSGLRSLRRALVGTGFPFKVLEMLPDYAGQMERVLRATAGIRRGGSAALDLCHLADGTFDAFWELYLEPWDVGAGRVIVAEAGGLVTRLDGSEPDLAGGSILAANSPALHQALRGVVRGEPPHEERPGR